jgi:hypothetical protein
MLFKIALMLLVVRLLGLLGIFGVGDAVHVFLLGGLMLLLIAGLKARDAAIHRRNGPRPG